MTPDKPAPETNPKKASTVDVDAIDPVQTHEIAALKHEVPLTTLRADPTSRFVAAGAQDLDVQLWSLADESRRTLKGHKSWVRSIDFFSRRRANVYRLLGRRGQRLGNRPG